jgi:hypothetical protein
MGTDLSEGIPAAIWGAKCPEMSANVVWGMLDSNRLSPCKLLARDARQGDLPWHGIVFARF